jgi:hypothetical protein
VQSKQIKDKGTSLFGSDYLLICCNGSGGKREDNEEFVFQGDNISLSSDLSEVMHFR